MKISISVMAHPKRANEAKAIYDKLNLMSFSSVTFVMDNQDNEWENGKRSWMLHDSSDWHIVIQDDAITGDKFYENVEQALSNVPQETLVSFYTGTVRPIPNEVKAAVEYAKENNISWLTYRTLCWGVCFAMPTRMIDDVLEGVKLATRINYDHRIGNYFRQRHLPVYYSMPSLVDHNDDLPSLTGHDRSVEKRVAHWFLGDDIVEWNDKQYGIIR